MQTIHQQIMYEIQQIPEAKLVDLYDTIRHFRLRVDSNAPVREPGLLKGKLGEAFFEPLPEDELRGWE